MKILHLDHSLDKLVVEQMHTYATQCQQAPDADARQAVHMEVVAYLVEQFPDKKPKQDQYFGAYLDKLYKGAGEK